MKLSESFYQRDNVVKIARELIGKGLFTKIGSTITGGMIVETEAYSWKERGCHAYGAKKTMRNAVMFEKGGHSYVYLCYGMHHLFNVVTNAPNVADAVLVRAIEPLKGVELMKIRRGKSVNERQLTSGPGKLTRALGIDRNWNGKLLAGDEIWIEDLEQKIPTTKIEASARIGIAYAGEDALLPWRFTLKGNQWLSKHT